MSQPDLTQAPTDPQFQHLLNKRILFKEDFGRIKYAGHLHHEVESPKIKKDDLWLGIEWETPGKGKHNGVVNYVRYFHTTDDVPNGSLIVGSKTEYGVDLLEGLINRYFKDHEIPEILKNKDHIMDYLKLKYEKEVAELSLKKKKRLEEAEKKRLEEQNQADSQDQVKENSEAHDQDKTAGDEFQMKEDDSEADKKKQGKKNLSDSEDSDSGSDSENMIIDEEGAEAGKEADGKLAGKKKRSQQRNELLDKLKSKIGNKDSYKDDTIGIEYDEDAYIKTFGERIKRIQFVGFDKVWERLHNLNKILSLGLNDQKISNLGPLGQFGQLCSNLDILSLEHNLFCSWDQVFILGNEAKMVSQLALSFNMLELENSEEINFSCLKSYNSIQQTLSIPNEISALPFQHLEHLILIQTGQNFKKLNVIVKHIPSLKHLILSKNHCNDFESINPEVFKNIVTLNLEDNNINCNVEDTGITQHKIELLGNLKSLSRLLLIKNNIQTFRDIKVFQNIEILHLSENNIANDSLIRELSTLPKLESLVFRRNPIITTLGEGHVKQLLIAYLKHLKDHNSDKRFDRKDCELYILRHCFFDYFNFHKLDQFTYKVEDFETWAHVHFPVVFRLIDKYENPYPPLDKSKLEQQELDTWKKLQEQSNYAKVKFICNNGPLIGITLDKNYPLSTDFLYIRNFLSSYFKMKKKEAIELRYRISPNDPFVLIDDLTKGLDYYGIKTGTHISVEQLGID